MGLDQFAYRTKAKFDREVDLEGLDTESFEAFQVQQWRKHANLQGWMRDLYEKKGGLNPDFNCVPVVLTPADIDDLERAVKAGRLPRTTGFFFGRSEPEDRDLDLEFIKKAREAHDEGDTVYYTSWW